MAPRFAAPLVLLSFAALAQTPPWGLHEKRPPGAIALPPPPCDIELRSEVKELRNGTVQVTVLARSRLAEPLEVELPDNCPNGPIQFSGLPHPYDYYRTCNQGACAPGVRTPQRVTLPRGRDVTLSTIVINPKGGTCNEPLPAARYTVSFVTPWRNACVSSYGSFGKAPPPPPPKKVEPPKKCPPMPACGIGCPGPMKRDANGCTLCACEESPFLR